MSRSVVVPWVAAAVLGAVALTLLVVLLVGGEDEVGSTGESSAVAACQLLDDVPDELDLDDDEAMTQFQARMGSASSLTRLAAAQDDTYSGLAEAVDRMWTTYVEQFSADVPEFTQARDDAEDRCGDVG
jgi:hypothetical protein